MIIKTLNRDESQRAMKEWISNFSKLPKIEGDYLKIRKDLQEFYKKVKEECDSEIKKDYYIDSHFGMLLYEYLWGQSGFSLRVAANDDFWRYLSIKVIPDIVADRCGKENESHYWSRATRIWLRRIWWYVHLSWQGDIINTKCVLEAPCFSTDSILNLEERSGRKGTFIDVYRYIMYYYSHIPKEKIQEFNKKTNGYEKDLFRTIMKLNTAKVMVINPALYLGGEKEYVKSLFNDVGVSVQ